MDDPENEGPDVGVGEELEDQTPLPVLKNKSEEALDEFFSELQEYIEKEDVSEDRLMKLLDQCLEKSGYELSDFNVVVSDELDISSAFSTMKKYVGRKNYLKDNREFVEEKLKSVKDGWFQKQGYYLNGIAFPLILKLHEGYLAIFLTCAHCAGRRDDIFFKSKILLTPSDSLDPDKSFVFELEKDHMIFGPDAKLDEDGHTLDFLALSLKGKKDRSGNDSVKHFWMANRDIKKGDKVFMATTHENCQTADVPYVAEGVIDEVLESVALHDIVGISGLSGECMYAPDKAKNKLECLLMFRGKLTNPEPYQPAYIGVPIASIQKYIEQLGEELKQFCFEKVPNDFRTEGFVQSYLVLLSDNDPPIDDSDLPHIDGGINYTGSVDEVICGSPRVSNTEENSSGSEDMELSDLPTPEESDDKVFLGNPNDDDLIEGGASTADIETSTIEFDPDELEN